MANDCPKGIIRRKGYITKRGSKTVRVKPSCIKATSASGTKRSPKDLALIRQREKIQKEIGKKYGNVRCPPGQIERAGYTRRGYQRKGYVRKDGTVVKSTRVGKSEVPPVCIKDTGAPGKGYKIKVVLEKGVLKKAGYASVKDLSLEQRHSALRKANKQIGNPLSLFRKLLIVSTLNRERDPKLAKIFRDDANWVKGEFGLLKTKPSNRSDRTSSSGNARSSSCGTKSSTKSSIRSSGSKSSGRKSSQRQSTSGRSRSSGSKTSRKK